ncbi:FAD/NAD(P)-binding domain-containing protein [Cadophora sp. DSE1049]|nr:FAD/NAD(P)-binding domain-containing protein [Cadophora sp. DSE1049]
MPFRVIVVGAGVVGLTASHCLQLAGIDHVVLEKRDDVAPAEGASIAIYPHGARILHQIGCLEPVQKASVPCGRWYGRMPDGRKILDNGYFRHLEENHGSGMYLLERREFLSILYDGLPNKSPIKTSSGVRGIRQLADGVEVTLINGDVEVGDIVIGCDGVYSTVRGFMWDHANKTIPDFITVQEKTSFKTRWKSLIGITPNIPELGERDLTVVSNTGYSFLGLAQPDRVYFFFIVRVDEPFTWPKQKRYTDEDAEILAQKFADHPVSNSLLFGELWKRRIRGGLVNLEEGVLEHWHHDRIVLAGDSAHKVMPNIALGGNSGMESVVVLCNHLERMMKNKETPSSATIDKVFAAYQDERLDRMKQISNLSSFITRIQAWDSLWHRFLGTWVLPLQPDRAMADQMGEIMRGAPKLDFKNVV